MNNYRLKDVVNSLDFNELMKMKKDLEYGGMHLKQFIEKEIHEREKEHEQFCAICSAKIVPSSTSNYTLVFGPDDFRKKASFCGIDCLEYFINDLKKIKRVVH